jgi:uncharacterized damage-inducible protein DinB
VAKREFAAWVEPFAGRYRESRAQVLGLARSLGVADFAKSAGDEGWSVRDEFVHISASDADFIETLGALLRGGTVDTSIFADIDARNARNLAERKDRAMAQIAGDLHDSGEALQDLLAKLTADDESRQPAGFPFPLRGLVEGYGMHEPYHLGQIRAAIGT